MKRSRDDFNDEANDLYAGIDLRKKDKGLRRIESRKQNRKFKKAY